VCVVDYGSWFDYVLDWDTVMKKGCLNRIHVVKYEDMKTVINEFNIVWYIIILINKK